MGDTDGVPDGLAVRIVGVTVVVPDRILERLSDPVPVACAERIVGDTEIDTVPDVEPDC